MGLGREPTALKWGYLAGIFDAEGYLGHVSRGDYYRVCVQGGGLPHFW